MKMLRKCRRIAAVALASAMIFGSMTVMAEGESIQAAEQETVVTDNEAAASGEEKTAATEEAVVSSEEEIAAEEAAVATVEAETAATEDVIVSSEEEIAAEELMLISGPWTGEDDIVVEVHTGANNRVEKMALDYFKDGAKLGTIESPVADVNVDETGNGTIVLDNEALKSFDFDWTEVDKVDLMVGFTEFENGEVVAGYQNGVICPVEFAVAEPEKPEEEPIFLPNVASWNGKDSISFTVDTKGGEISEFSYNVYTTSSEEPFGGAYAWMDHLEGDIDKSGVGAGNILFTDTLADFCEKHEIDEKEVEKIEFFLAVRYEGVSERVVKTVTLPVELADVDWEKGEYRLANGKTYYLLDAKLGNGVLGYEPIWSGPEDVREAVKDGKTYYFVLPNSEYPLNYMFDIDAKYKDTNNPISIKDGYELQVKVVSGDGTAEPAGHGAPDWVIKFTASKATTFEVSVVEEGAGELEETTTIKDNSGKSGVSMKIPAGAPEGLTLKVTESNGAAEKEAVSKLVQVEGDKIKTFDLSLFMEEKEWSYDGQFKSTVTLPVPEGWNIGALGLYYFDEAANKAIAVPFTVDKANHTLTFETEHFSRFVMVQKDVKADGSENTGKPEGQGKPADTNKPADNRPAGQNNAQNTNIPKTGDDTNVVFYMALLLVAGAAIVGYARKRRA